MTDGDVKRQQYDALRSEFEPKGLCANGFEFYKVKRAKFWDERNPERLVDEVERATTWLKLCGRRKTINRSITSYGLKHEAEWWCRNNDYCGDAGGYVSNGALIMAAMRMGFTVELVGGQCSGSPNGWLNISQYRPGRHVFVQSGFRWTRMDVGGVV